MLATETMNLAEVRDQLTGLVNRVRRKEARVLVEESGVPVAAIVSPEDLRRLDQLDEEREADFAVVDELREAFKDVPAEEIEREADRAIAEARAKEAASIR
jgi:prevent-host-death family protein